MHFISTFLFQNIINPRGKWKEIWFILCRCLEAEISWIQSINYVEKIMNVKCFDFHISVSISFLFARQRLRKYSDTIKFMQKVLTWHQLFYMYELKMISLSLLNAMSLQIVWCTFNVNIIQSTQNCSSSHTSSCFINIHQHFRRSVNIELTVSLFYYYYFDYKKGTTLPLTEYCSFI